MTSKLASHSEKLQALLQFACMMTYVYFVEKPVYYAAAAAAVAAAAVAAAVAAVVAAAVALSLVSSAHFYLTLCDDVFED